MSEPSVARMVAVAEKYAIPGIKIRYKRLKGPIMRDNWMLPRDNHLEPAHANLLTAEALMPYPETREKLYVNLHERGHLKLKHFGRHWTRSEFKRQKYTRKNELPRHIEEYQAEMFAHRAMRENGISVPRKMTTMARHYIQWCIREDQKDGIKIDPVVAAWAGRDREMEAIYKRMVVR